MIRTVFNTQTEFQVKSYQIIYFPLLLPFFLTIRSNLTNLVVETAFLHNEYIRNQATLFTCLLIFKLFFLNEFKVFLKRIEKYCLILFKAFSETYLPLLLFTEISLEIIVTISQPSTVYPFWVFLFVCFNSQNTLEVNQFALLQYINKTTVFQNILEPSSQSSAQRMILCWYSTLLELTPNVRIMGMF